MPYDRMHRHQRRSSKLGRIVVLFIIASTLTAAGVYAKEKTSNQIISPIADDKRPASPIIRFFTRAKNPDNLQKAVQEKIGNTWKNYSVYVEDLTGDFSMGINESVIFTAASINKLPILATVYYNSQTGEVDLDKVIVLQEDDIQDYGTGSIRYDLPGTPYSVKTLARLMMQKSDNTAAFLLGNYVVSLERVQNLIRSWGLTQTDMVNNKTSNKDMAILMKKIFDRHVTNDALTQEMLAFMKDSDFEDRLPALIPKEATVYHKIGTGTGAVHDVGIVVSNKKAYYVGIFTSDITDEEQAAKLASEVSKLVYDFMVR